jgi:hypothetical protein
MIQGTENMLTVAHSFTQKLNLFLEDPRFINVIIDTQFVHLNLGNEENWLPTLSNLTLFMDPSFPSNNCVHLSLSLSLTPEAYPHVFLTPLYFIEM